MSLHEILYAGAPVNYLAHLFCSKDSPDSLLGNCIADLVKGRADSRLPPAVAEGIRHHRKADQFTDAHAVFRASKRLVSHSRQRYSGVIIIQRSRLMRSSRGSMIH